MAASQPPIVVPDSGLEVWTQPVGAQPVEKVSLETHSSTVEKGAPMDLRSRSRGFWQRRWVWIVCTTAVVITAVVAGTVGGIVSNRNSSNGVENSITTASSTPTPTSTTLPDPVMSGNATAASSYLYPTALSGGHHDLEILALSSNRSVHWKYRLPTAEDPGDWEPPDTLGLIGGVVAKFQNGVAAVKRAVGTMDIFVTGYTSTGYGLFHKYHADKALTWGPVGYHNWDYLGGALYSGPIAVSSGEFRIDIFAIGVPPTYQLIQRTWTGVWSDWIELGGTWSTYAPTARVRDGGRIDVFVVNPVTYALYYKGWDGSTWQPSDTFTKLGGYCTSRPVATSSGTGLVDVFVRGGDAGLWHLSSLDDTWSNWTLISGNMTMQGEPGLLSWGDGRLDVFAWGSDDSLLHKSAVRTEDNERWTWSPSEGFEIIGAGLSGPPKAATDGTGSLHVFAYGYYGQLIHRAWNESVNRWTPENEFEVLGTVPQSVGVATSTTVNGTVVPYTNAPAPRPAFASYAAAAAVVPPPPTPQKSASFQRVQANIKKLEDLLNEAESDTAIGRGASVFEAYPYFESAAHYLLGRGGIMIITVAQDGRGGHDYHENLLNYFNAIATQPAEEPRSSDKTNRKRRILKEQLGDPHLVQQLWTAKDFRNAWKLYMRELNEGSNDEYYLQIKEEAESRIRPALAALRAVILPFKRANFELEQIE